MNAAWKHYKFRGRLKIHDNLLRPCVIAMLSCFDTVGSIGIPFTRKYSQGWFPHLYPMPNVRTVRLNLPPEVRQTVKTLFAVG